MTEQVNTIQATNPGVLEVPEGKDVMELPLSHFEALAKKVGLSEVVKALLNLWRWNQEKNPKLSAWAKDMQEKLSKSMEK